MYNKVLIIDGSYMLHRNLHIEELNLLTDNNGNKTGGLFGFMRSLLKACKSVKQGYMPIICWDSGLSERRLKIYPNYKNNVLQRGK